MNINLELYKTFYYVAKNKNISRAANELLISQPAISKSIKTLEEQLNTSLFIRKRDGMELTEAGEALYKKVKDAMELISSAENDLEVITSMESGAINIGASRAIIQNFLMPYIKEFHKKYPKINVRIFPEKTSELVDKSKKGIIDVIFTNMPYNLPNNFDSIRLFPLHDCLAASSAFDYLKNKKISKKELSKLPLLLLTRGATTRMRFDDYCSENNIIVHPEMEFGSNTLIKEFTEAGFGIGLFTSEHIKKELESGDLFKLKLEVPLKETYLGMIWNKDNRSLVANNFIEYIKNNITK
ncbi:MAG: LysR family transcriptional regulator [Bacilli bacterium]|nr:LysR family transcriptional regulator [Bacilli bacterium]